MSKEPLGLYLLRILVAIGLFVFMAMLYWSSLSLEERTRSIQNKLEQVDTQIQELKDTLTTGAIVANPNVQPTQEVATASQYSNLLSEDPFYKKTLSTLLPGDFKPHGSFHSGTIGKPDTLHPFSNWAGVSEWLAMCNISVARLHFGFYDKYAPDGALRVEQRDREDKPGVPEFWVFLRKNAFWQPLNKDWFSEDIALAPHFLKKHPVTAHDYKLFFDAMKNPYNQDLKAVSLRNYYSDLEEIKVIDDYTFVVRWKTHLVDENGKQVPKIKFMAQGLTLLGFSPLPGFVFKYFADGTKILEDDSDPEAYRNSSVWAQNLARHWAKNIIPSCGAWLFKGMSDTQIAFERNKQFYLPLEVLVKGNEVQFKDSTDAIWQEFKANKYELYNLQPDKVLELEQFLKTEMYKQQAANGSAIKRLDYLGRSYTYIAWNQTKPWFTSRRVRQALTMAIDRQRIIRDYLQGMGEEVTGTFYKYSPSMDPSIKPLPYDPRQAKQILEQEGWFDSNGDGIIDKTINGENVPFKFQLTYYVKNNVSKSIAEYVATALKGIGIGIELHGIDQADLSSTVEDKSFDALILGWALGVPPEDPRQLWSSEGAEEKGSSNMVGFKNKEVDQIIDQLDYEYNPEKRQQLYYKFDKILYEEQPYTFLFSPKVALLYREYVQNVFVPKDKQDLVPGAQVTTPDGSIYWLKRP